MKTTFEFFIIIVVTVLVTASLRQFELNDMVRAFVSVVVGVLAGRLFALICFNQKKDN